MYTLNENRTLSKISSDFHLITATLDASNGGSEHNGLRLLYGSESFGLRPVNEITKQLKYTDTIHLQQIYPSISTLLG